MNVLFLLKVANVAGQMLCMTVQPHTVQVQRSAEIYRYEILAAEATTLQQNVTFSGMQPYEVNFNGKIGTVGCFTKDIFPN